MWLAVVPAKGHGCGPHVRPVLLGLILGRARLHYVSCAADPGGSGLGLFLVGSADGPLDERVVWREVADGIGRRRITGELERLAAAPTEVHQPARTCPAGVGHPV